MGRSVSSDRSSALLSASRRADRKLGEEEDHNEEEEGLGEERPEEVRRDAADQLGLSPGSVLLVNLLLEYRDPVVEEEEVVVVALGYPARLLEDSLARLDSPSSEGSRPEYEPSLRSALVWTGENSLSWLLGELELTQGRWYDAVEPRDEEGFQEEEEEIPPPTPYSLLELRNREPLNSGSCLSAVDERGKRSLLSTLSRPYRLLELSEEPEEE